MYTLNNWYVPAITMNTRHLVRLHNANAWSYTSSSHLNCPLHPEVLRLAERGAHLPCENKKCEQTGKDETENKREG